MDGFCNVIVGNVRIVASRIMRIEAMRVWRSGRPAPSSRTADPATREIVRCAERCIRRLPRLSALAISFSAHGLDLADRFQIIADQYAIGGTELPLRLLLASLHVIEDAAIESSRAMRSALESPAPNMPKNTLRGLFSRGDPGWRHEVYRAAGFAADLQ